MKIMVAMAFATSCLVGAAYAEQRNSQGEDSKGLWQINVKAKKDGSLKSNAAPKAKESGEKGGTEDINIGVGELHGGKVNKVEGFTTKQNTRRAYNPKEFKLDEKATWKASPKTKMPNSRTLCTTPDGKRRAC